MFCIPIPADGSIVESHVAPIATYAKSGMRRTTIEISKTVNVSLHFADRNNIQLTVANTESKPAAARIICNCPRLMFGRLQSGNAGKN